MLALSLGGTLGFGLACCCIQLHCSLYSYFFFLGMRFNPELDIFLSGLLTGLSSQRLFDIRFSGRHYVIAYKR